MGWFRSVRESLEDIADESFRTNTLLEGLLVSNVETQAKIDEFATAVTDEAGTIANAVAVVSSEIQKLRTALTAAGDPDVDFDFTKLDEAKAALTGSVDTLQALEPVTVPDEPEAPVETPEAPVEVPVEETPVEETPVEVPVEEIPEDQFVNPNLR